MIGPSSRPVPPKSSASPDPCQFATVVNRGTIFAHPNNGVDALVSGTSHAVRWLSDAAGGRPFVLVAQGSPPDLVLLPGPWFEMADDQSGGKRAVGSVSPWVWAPVVLLTALSVWGSSYYFAPTEVRVRHEMHDWLRPSGWVGQSAGIVTLAGLLFLWLYPLRKKIGARKGFGPLPKWLDVHIVVGLTICYFGAVHSAWRFDGVIGLGWWAMFIVALSGVIGRYVYVHIPRGWNGLELSAEDLAQKRRQLLVELAGITGLQQALVESELAADPPKASLSILGGLLQMARDDFERRRAVRRLRGRCRRLIAEGADFDESALDRVVVLARQQMALSQQARLLHRTQTIFRYWHVFHKPVAMTALLAVLIHVIVVVVVGSTWFY